MRAVVASTTGVSKTTVASRVSTAVTAAASATTRGRRRVARPRARPLGHCTQVVEHAEFRAELAEDQDGNQEGDGRRQLTDRMTGSPPRLDADHDQQQRSGNREH